MTQDWRSRSRWGGVTTSQAVDLWHARLVCSAKNLLICPVFLEPPPRKSLLSALKKLTEIDLVAWNDVDAHGDIHIRVQMQLDLLLADRAERPQWQTHLSLFDLDAGSSDGLGDIGGAD